MNTFSQIISKVGVRVGDTSSGFSTTIGMYVNDRYLRVFKKFNWPTIVPSYSITTTADTTDYVLPSDFKHELYVFDTTNNKDIVKMSLQDLEITYPDGLLDQGNVFRYAIFESLDSTSPSPLIQKTLRFFENPTQICVYNVPYIKQGVPLVATTDLPIIDMADLASELGATADAWRTKRQFQKASDFEVQYEKVIQEMVWSIANDPNMVVQFRPNVYPIHQLY